MLLKDFKLAFLYYFIMLCLCHHNNGFFSVSIMPFITRRDFFLFGIVEKLTASNSQLSHQHEAIIKDRLEGSFLSKVFFILFQDDNISPCDFFIAHSLSCLKMNLYANIQEIVPSHKSVLISLKFICSADC